VTLFFLNSQIFFELIYIANNNYSYKFLNNFDIAMNHLESKYHWLMSSRECVSRKNQGDKVIVFERANLLFIFNFHPTNSFTDYKVGTNIPGVKKIALDSDSPEFGGHARNDPNVRFHTTKEEHDWDGCSHSLMVYIPNRTVLVLETE
jgi:1,4-alpha-glucan branching enzyme